MATAAIPTQEFVDSVSPLMACGIETAVECWLAEVEQALSDTQLGLPDRLSAARAVLERYKRLTGKTHFHAPACKRPRIQIEVPHGCGCNLLVLNERQLALSSCLGPGSAPELC